MSNNSQNLADVLIIGAGPVGLAAACELARRGLSVHVIEQHDGPSEHSKALAVQVRSIELLDRMGAVAAFLKAGRRLNTINFYDSHQRLARLELPMGDSPFPFLLALPQSQTEQLLAEHLKTLGVEVQWKSALKSLVPGDDTVTAVIAGSDGREISASYGWVIGCDGAHSTVRKQIGLTFEGVRTAEWFAVADVRVEWSLAGREIHAFLSPDGPLAFFPLPENGRYRIVGPLPMQPIEETPKLELADFQRFVDQRVYAPTKLSDSIWTSVFLIQRRIVGQYRQKRVFLAGDAAHIHSPVGGQGMNTGIQDVCNLAWKLALVVKGKANDALLDSYHAERHPIGKQTLNNTKWATNIVTLRNPAAQWLRKMVLRAIAPSQWIRERIGHALSMNGIGYRGSPVVGQQMPPVFECLFGRGTAAGSKPSLKQWIAFARGPRPGDRAPDVMLAGAGPNGIALTLFEILRGQEHVLLSFSGSDTADDLDDLLLKTSSELRRRYGNLFSVRAMACHRASMHEDPSVPTTYDSDCAVHQRYGARGACWYLIRPDGHIAWRSLPPDRERLLDYLARIYVSNPPAPAGNKP